jgi:hypothetical protein
MHAERQQALWNSVYVGLIGYLAVALFFLLVDPLLGRGFLYTPALLGSALFYGLTDPAALTIQPGPVIAYNGAHLVVFVVLGLLVGQLTHASLRLRQQGWYLIAVLGMLVLGHLYVALWALTEPVRSALPVWMLTVAGLVAMAAMAIGALVIYPELREEVLDREDRSKAAI